MNLPIPESYWVEPGRFLAGEYPGSYDPETARHRIEAFLQCGINTFIDLTQPHELVPYESILKEQADIYDIRATYQRMAIRDHYIPTRETMLHILNTIDEALTAGRNVYVHCWGGIGRTGTTVGCHLIRRGQTNDKALKQVAEWFKSMPKHVYYPSSPETQVQIDFVSNWQEIPEGTHKSQEKFCEG